jgi:hypothetical protein
MCLVISARVNIERVADFHQGIQPLLAQDRRQIIYRLVLNTRHHHCMSTGDDAVGNAHSLESRTTDRRESVAVDRLGMQRTGNIKKIAEFTEGIRDHCPGLR